MMERKMDGFSFPNPGIGWSWIIDLLIKALSVVMPILTPTLRKALEDFLLDWYKKALETANPWDDFVARLLLRLLGIPIPE